MIMSMTREQDAELREAARVRQAAGRAATRERRLDSAYDLIRDRGQARVTELAAGLGITPVEARDVIARLAHAGSVRRVGPVAVFIPIPE